MLPTGNAGKNFIDEIIRLLNSWIDDNDLASISFKAILVMPSLLLQKPSKTSKAKDHLKTLEKRLELWNKGELMSLYKECITIQETFITLNKKRTSIDKTSKKFAKLMHQGNINGAIKLLSDSMNNGILPLNEETLVLLKQKHPKKQTASDLPLLTDNPVEQIHPVRFEEINSDMVRKAASKTRGGSGPSSMDADAWRKPILSNNHGEAPKNLCTAISKVCKKICTTDCDKLTALLACRLIPFDKKPGLRPIGVGEVLRRITGKVVIFTLKGDVKRLVGSLQICAGHEAGGEAAVHAMRGIFAEEETEAVLLVDAANVFNSVNRKVFLHNVKIICPPISTFVQNCYSEACRLFVIDGYDLSSEEGTTQGDPISMAVYAIATITLILMLLEYVTNNKYDSVKEIAYADDLSAGEKINDLRK